MSAERLRGIGGTAISAIVGRNPYRSALDVWAELCGYAEPQAQTERMAWGLRLEPVILRAYAEATGREVVPVEPLRHPAEPWAVAHLDGEVPGEAVVDAKSTTRDEGWGEPGTDQVPEHVVLQVQWYAGMRGLPRADVPLLLRGSELRIYQVAADAELYGLLLDAGRRFWRDHIETQSPPAIDGSENAARYLARRWPHHDSEMLPATPAVEEQIAALRDARARAAAAEADQRAAENQIKAWLGEHEGCTSSLGKLTWRAARDSRITDWQAVARILGAPESIVADNTTTRPGARRFLTPRDWGRGDE